MAFKRFRGKTKLMYFKGDTAVQVRDGSLVRLNDSASIDIASNDSTNDFILGVARRNDTTTDSALVPVEVPVENAVEWLINTDTDGGALDSDVGRLVTVDTAGGTIAGDSCGLNLDVSDSSAAAGPAGCVVITGIVSATQVIGVIAHSVWHQTYDTAA